MDWTFGIITDGHSDSRISTIIKSIAKEDIPNYEIIIVGNSKITSKNTTVIPFDESIKSKWITKKKNIIPQHAKFNNLCMMHDYIKLMPSWYMNFVNFGDNWDVCMNRIENVDGVRFRDWVQLGTIKLLPYTDHSLTNTMYVSGAYFCVKTQYMRDHPFDESKSWGEGEDVEWSCNLRDTWVYKCNSKSVVKLIKEKQLFPIPTKQENLGL